MKKITIILFILFSISSYNNAQYVVKSTHILNPDLNIEYVRNNAEFWIKYAYEPTYGGFYSQVNRDGSLRSTTKKSFMAQTRHGYGFTRAFMLTGDEKYLTFAKSALDFMTTYGWDKTNEGWYYLGLKNGALDNNAPSWNYNSNKWSFQQHYALLGIIANYEATQDAGMKAWMEKGLNSVNTHMWDARVGYEGYYEDASADWSTKSAKGFTPTVDAVTTHAELAYLVTQKPELKTRLLELGDIMVKRFVASMDDSRVKVLYPESYDSNWNWGPTTPKDNSMGSVGHFIKTAWCLGRAYLCDTTKKELKNAAIKILDESWTYKNGAVTVWDHTNGGPFTNIDVFTGNWKGNANKKEYWMMEQGFTAPMLNYYITKNPIYLQMADESLNYFMNNFVDKVYGEIYSVLNADGTIAGTTKGDDYKASYHSNELGYYAYLYSNLYYLHKPASLYYKFAPTAAAQSIQLTPIPFENGVLRIKSVTLDGADFKNFNAQNRTLEIAANQGGKFKVTFESIPTSPTAVALVNNVSIKMYPNPTTNLITIEGMEDINSLCVSDLTGKILIHQQIGEQNSINVDLQNLKSGVYLVMLQNKNGVKTAHKISKQ